jgi:hypothetical protein
MSAGPRLRSISFLVKGSSYFAFRLVLCDATQSCTLAVTRSKLSASNSAHTVGTQLLVMLTEHRCNSRRLCYFVPSAALMLSHTGALFAGMDPDRVSRSCFAARQAAGSMLLPPVEASRHPVRTEPARSFHLFVLLLAQRHKSSQSDANFECMATSYAPVSRADHSILLCPMRQCRVPY